MVSGGLLDCVEDVAEAARRVCVERVFDLALVTLKSLH